jgi:hypothetical protein
MGYDHCRRRAPPPEAMTKGRELLGGRATLRRNRATLGDRQLRLGRDGRWYPFRRSGPGAGTSTWTPEGSPLDAPGGLGEAEVIR